MPNEPKARTQLKRKAFSSASRLPSFAPDERALLAKSCLEKGALIASGTTGIRQTEREIVAYRQAGIAFAFELLSICSKFQATAFASVVDRGAPAPSEADFLRKDYSYLFERYYYHVRDHGPDEHGVIVFDELEKSQCHILIDQMRRYFLLTTRGRERAKRIIPEPFFVHSDLTTMILVADYLAYVVAWGTRLPGMTRPRRNELWDLAQVVWTLQYESQITADDGSEHNIWGFKRIDDLRPESQQLGDIPN